MKLPSLSSVLRTDRLEIRPPRAQDVGALRSLLRSNEEHLRPWSPLPPPGSNPTSLVSVAERVADERRKWRADVGYSFLVFSITQLGDFHERRLVGRVALSHVSRGAFQNAYLGYFVDGDEQSRGLTTEAVRAVVSFALGPVEAKGLGLHRIQAAVVPRNQRSRRVLAKAGFREEGLARRYLAIAGTWEDHVIYARTAEDERAE
jgi:ribosomal-protein-alanine N-acetyltransferase